MVPFAQPTLGTLFLIQEVKLVKLGAAQTGMKSALGTFAVISQLIFEPRCEKTGLPGFRPGTTQTGLHSHRRKLET